MYDPVDSSGMPLRIADSAPRFAGDGTQLVNSLESVERLVQPLGLTDKEIIKNALKYTNLLITSWIFWPECGVCHYTRPIFEKPAAIEAPLASAPPQPECAQEQQEAEAIAPIAEIRDTISAPAVLEAPFDIITQPSVQLEACIISAPQEPISTPEYPSAKDIPPKLEVCEPITVQILPEAPLEEIIPPLVSDDLKHLSAVMSPIPEPSEAPEANNAPLSDQVMSLETLSVADTSVLVAFSAHSDYYPQVQYLCTIPPQVSDDFKHLSSVSDDSQHPLHPNAPIPEPSAATEVQNAPISDQSMSLVTPSITDHSTLIAFSTYSDYRLPVMKHPCITSPIRQLDHVSNDSDVPPARCHTPEVTQVMHLEALYIHPRSMSHFSSISCLKLSRSQTLFPIISPLSPHHFIVNSSFKRRIHAPHAYIPALYAPIIAEEFSCYRIFIISSVFSCVFSHPEPVSF
ncbi:hypothetical protein DFJ58DRAFT_728641 [Suillus subalutaceus]|uniref:uncharacterized protein n=1 Tax=Suillus subalutaceus TaxID=48586 RepID=UPI001B873B83|nr:uncharacterized protein DFJ58DRAFT_728641 [Suillus subalutaceus]KAG1852093.1 hypothetical protein DFJ58DRAFT_728641 [Suillus subalutaceus]